VNLNKLQKYILDEISLSKTFIALEHRIIERKNTSITGIFGSALACIIATLRCKTSAPFCIVTAKQERADEIFDDLEFFGCDSVFHFPSWEVLPYEPDEPHMDIAAKQLDTYGALLEMNRGKTWPAEEAPIIVAPLDALFPQILSLDFFETLCLKLSWGEEMNIEDLARRLSDIGYSRTPMVEARGEFSIRGGIVDIFPLNLPDPVRLDLFGREIESIRFFDPYTQRSFKSDENGESITIAPAQIFGMIHKSVERKIPLAPFFPCLAPGTILIFDELAAFPEMSRHFEELLERQYFEASARGEEHIPPHILYTDWQTLSSESGKFQLISHTALPVYGSSGDESLRFVTSSFHEMEPSLDYYMDLMKRRQDEDFTVCVVCDNEGQLQRFDELLRERELSALKFDPAKPDSATWKSQIQPGELKDIILSVGSLHEGFLVSEAKILLLTDREIFGRYKRRHIYRKIYKGTPISAPSEIKRGDYIVHLEHGIGQFLGIRTQNIDGRNVDLLELLYADNARLLVPVERIKSVQKYSLVENVQPPLDELGSKRWLQRKKKTEEKIENMARELLILYAQREIARSYTFSPDSVWQSEFESSFIYEETPDQLTAIQQVKRDLEEDKPMDRLVCGDVGYGKTEVAIRAAFKAVQEHKQVAVLAPTTILCQQHYNTFSERFAEYPFKVEMLSRFRTHTEQKKILQRLKNGEIHIIIGTHRLLSKDVAFSDLGLVVVDEEQRFGVRHKERLKELRTTVHFMTLTATPIPRTLYMALSGLRDLSIINTPPPNRLPIKTKIIHWDDELIREAIMREMNRGGQIFFVHNRINNIDQMARRLQDIVPDLKICIGHGRLHEHELEQVMIDFIDRKYDLLLSTTIIENGLDIPNVNTIIINRADAFGLAQLYQLRGRVGRDVKKAYAYLITPHGEPITDAAVRRLAAIEEFTELGVGFNIAMRDLEIRGSGNILGKEQHGCIMSVGFDFYCKLLEKTVKRLKGEKVEEERPVEIKWSVESQLPADYIPVESQRVGIYKRLSEAASSETIRDIREELRDRYGELPGPAENLLKIAELRVLASIIGLSKVILTSEGFKMTDGTEKDIIQLRDNFDEARMHTGEPFRIKVEDPKTLSIVYPSWSSAPQLDKALKLLSHFPPENVK